MIATLKSAWHWPRQKFEETEASQIVELAVSLPLLVLFLVGVTDFSQAFRLRHQLDIAVQQSVRVASNQTMVDITNTTPGSTVAIRDAVDAALVAMKVNDCGLATATGTASGLMWTYNTTGTCPAAMIVTIDRGRTFQVTGGNPVKVEATRVTIAYPYQWRFNRVVQLLFSGSSFTGPTQIKAEAIAQNLN